MAPKAGVVSLVTFAPTDEELKAARALLSSADFKGKKKSYVNSMNQFLKSNAADKGNAELLEKPSADRAVYIEKYLAYQTAKKSGRLSHTRSNVAENLSHRNVLQWNQWKCEKEIGPEKYKSWKDSGKLPSIPDPLTNSSEPHMLVYLVPEAWTQSTHGERDAQVLEADGVASLDDVKNSESVRAGGVPGSSSGTNVPGTKQEVQSSADAEKEMQAAFTASKNEKNVGAHDGDHGDEDLGCNVGGQ